jgi:hypothetical protein
VNRASVGALIVLALVVVGFAIAVMLARSTPASQEHTWWRGLLDGLFARDVVAARGDAEQRPPLVVRGPASNFDGGDRLDPSPKWRGWTMVSSGNDGVVWKPDQAAGAPVRTFEVTALNAIGTPTCPVVPFLADRIDLVYAGTAKPQTASIHSLAGKGNKPEPVIETTLRLTSGPGSDAAPDTLAYTADGVLTGFTATYQGKAAASCTFNAQGGAYLRVVPLR